MITIHNGWTTPSGRNAFTLLEMLVVIAVIGLIAVLLIPAVQSARESSRRLQCATNMKQLGLAISTYETTWRVLPRGQHVYALHTAILPYLEHAPLYNSLNFRIAAPMPQAMIANRTAASTTLSLYVCPSDSAAHTPGELNYAGNWGVGFDRYAAKNNGPFASPGGIPPVALSQVVDGTSETAAMSEYCRGFKSPTDPKRTVFETVDSIVGVDGFNQFAAECSSTDPYDSIVNGFVKGVTWVPQELGQTLYNHALPPNGHTCTNGKFTREGAWTAGSMHTGGVNLLLLDGHVSFVKETVVQSVWHSVGTMNGAEIVDKSQF